jgi:hypothetical protein
MTTDNRMTWGLVLNIGGFIGFLFAMGISATGIGACLGIPLAIICLPLAIWGAVWIYQARTQKAQQIIAAGVAAGIRAGVAPRTADATQQQVPATVVAGTFPPMPPASTAPVKSLAPPAERCRQCSAELTSGAAFCAECGTPVKVPELPEAPPA